MLDSRLLLEQMISSEVSCRGERMHAFGGIVLDASCGVWWVSSMALVNGDGFFPSAERR